MFISGSLNGRQNELTKFDTWLIFEKAYNEAKVSNFKPKDMEIDDNN
jgi:hypothetical protein